MKKNRGIGRVAFGILCVVWTLSGIIIGSAIVATYMKEYITQDNIIMWEMTIGFLLVLGKECCHILDLQTLEKIKITYWRWL